MLHPIKVTSTLADETRFSIYEYMVQYKRPISVQEIADEFQIHSNVARLHLTKLAEIGAITAEFLKTGKGGRPGRVYQVKQEGIQLSFPYRDSSSLLNWCIQLIDQLGDDALQQAKKISYEDGRRMMRELITTQSEHSPQSFDEKLALLTKSAHQIGYVPEVLNENHSKTVFFAIYNCPFYKQMTTNGKITCQLHESFLRGQVEILFGNSEFAQFESMLHNCDYCKYKITINN
ncbi:helix-turn-helix transcriptional regulator [Solibacillus daqui]|uniref:helix-turn-helix transcriptional regulator n=1 Tax=Solibacillus daqui TaxID=2912187 RepID=UPI002365A235|nr:helix-turn-helix domain-containing protein [Solibacillus daqui]